MNKILTIFLIFVILIVGCSNEIENISDNEIKQEVENMELKSQEFSNNGNIPDKFTCKGEDINPQLEISGIPESVKSLVLIVDDPDASVGTWDHWIVFNIEPTGKIEENSVPGTEGVNSWGKNNYGGPCPPSGTHRYFFKLYALDVSLELDSSAAKTDVEKAIEGHVLDKTELIGLYSKG